ncbi:hypothetical protein BaRGS_00040530, partial [Batillaria attramentaria]
MNQPGTLAALTLFLLCARQAGCHHDGPRVRLPSPVTSHVGHQHSLSHIAFDDALPSDVRSTVFADTRDITCAVTTSATTIGMSSTHANVSVHDSMMKISTQSQTTGGSDTGHLASPVSVLKYDLHSFLWTAGWSQEPFNVNYELTNTTNIGGIIFNYTRDITYFDAYFSFAYFRIRLKVKNGM